MKEKTNAAILFPIIISVMSFLCKFVKEPMYPIGLKEDLSHLKFEKDCSVPLPNLRLVCFDKSVSLRHIDNPAKSIFTHNQTTNFTDFVIDSK